MKVNTIAIFGILLVLSACRHTEGEVKRTKVQLERLASEVGAENALDSAKQLYRENLQPLVNKTGEVVSNTGESVLELESLQSVKNASEQISNTVGETRAMMNRVADNVMDKIPRNEQELTRRIDDYNQDFANWLRSNYKSLDLSVGENSKKRTEKIRERLR